MNLDTLQVLELFRVLAGLEEPEARCWEPLALGCARQIAARTRPGADTDEAREALALAAAGTLLYQYAAAGTAGGESIQLGDLSVSPAGSAGEARALRDSLLAAAAPYLEPGGAFLVQVVPGHAD